MTEQLISWMITLTSHIIRCGAHQCKKLNQSTTWLQLHALRHVDMIKTPWKWHRMWHRCQCQTSWSKYFRNCSSTGVLTPVISIEFTENGLKKREQAVSSRSLERIVWSGWRWWTETSDLSNHVTTKLCTTPFCHTKSWIRWARAAEGHNGCCSCQLRTDNSGHNSQGCLNCVGPEPMAWKCIFLAVKWQKSMWVIA